MAQIAASAGGHSSFDTEIVSHVFRCRMTTIAPGVGADGKEVEATTPKKVKMSENSIAARGRSAAAAI
jgi:hypothetical protein